MKVLVIFVLTLTAVALASSVHGSMRLKKKPLVTQVLVDRINNMQTTWKASLDQGKTVSGISLEEARTLCGSLKGGPQLPPQPETFSPQFIAALPAQFSAITNWPFCPSISFIRDQSACGSCWAFGAAEAMSDRMCIKLNVNVSLSAGDMAFCAGSAGNGCDGGYPPAAWQYWVSNGLVEEACYPYPFPGCDHHIPSSSDPCPQTEYPSPPCPNKCMNKSWTGPAWKSDKHFGAKAYALGDVSQIQAEIFKNGPVEASFDVYSDFLTYKSGVYVKTRGSTFLGGHAIKVLGWGTLKGTDYWLCANSWNPDWGMNGFFMIKRGVDECGIEDGMCAGLPKN